jgi:hypothetical protein
MSLSTTTLTNLADTDIRIVIEDECSSCGPVGRSPTAGLYIIHHAARHTAETGHVVILNGTVDRPDLEEREILQ